MKFKNKYAFIFIDEIEIKFFKTKESESLSWFQYIDVFV